PGGGPRSLVAPPPVPRRPPELRALVSQRGRQRVPDGEAPALVVRGSHPRPAGSGRPLHRGPRRRPAGPLAGDRRARRRRPAGALRLLLPGPAPGGGRPRP